MARVIKASETRWHIHNPNCDIFAYTNTGAIAVKTCITMNATGNRGYHLYDNKQQCQVVGTLDNIIEGVYDE